MKGKLNLIISAILLVSLIGFVYPASYSDSLSIGIEDGVPECNPDWECALTECIGGTQTWICTDNNQCCTDLEDGCYPSNHGDSQECHYCGDGICNTDETCSTCSTDCGTCSSPPPAGGGGGGGGGGGSTTTHQSSGGGAINDYSSELLSGSAGSCTESWVCGAWSDSKDECGTRTCEDTNKCGTEKDKPITEKECPTFSLFSWTGSTVEGITDFAKSPTGVGSLLGMVIIIAGIAFFVVKKKSSKK